MMALLDWIDAVPSLTPGQWLVCVVPLFVLQSIILLWVIHHRHR